MNCACGCSYFRLHWFRFLVIGCFINSDSERGANPGLDVTARDQHDKGIAGAYGRIAHKFGAAMHNLFVVGIHYSDEKRVCICRVTLAAGFELPRELADDPSHVTTIHLAAGI